MRVSPGTFGRKVHKHLLCVRHLDHTARDATLNCCDTVRKLLNIDAPLKSPSISSLKPAAVLPCQSSTTTTLYQEFSPHISLTKWSRVLPEKLALAHLLMTFPASYGIRRLIPTEQREGTGK
jgi:hypothetical protein